MKEIDLDTAGVEDLASSLLQAALLAGDSIRTATSAAFDPTKEACAQLMRVSSALSKRFKPDQPKDRIHCVKCWPELFEALVSGNKLFDIRLNDRGYQPGDVLVSQEFDPKTSNYSGNMVAHRITYVLPLHGKTFFRDFPDGYVAMSIKPWSIPLDIEQRIRMQTQIGQSVTERTDQSWCPQCGYGAVSDEEGCCVQCGATLISDQVYNAIEARAFDRCIALCDCIEAQCQRQAQTDPMMHRNASGASMCSQRIKLEQGKP